MRKPQKLEMKLVREKTLKLFFSATNDLIFTNCYGIAYSGFCHAKFISASHKVFSFCHQCTNSHEALK